MEQGHALLALIAIPLLTAAGMILVPSNKKDLLRYIAVAVSAVMFAIALYVFFENFG